MDHSAPLSIRLSQTRVGKLFKLLILCMVATPAFAKGLVLWNRCEYGMSIAQVKNLHPKIHQTFLGGAKTIVYALDDVAIEGVPCRAVLVFSKSKDGSLHSIYLECKEPFLLSDIEVKNYHHLWVNLLTKKYGNPVMCRNEYVWFVGVLRVSMFTYGLTIYYQYSDEI